MRSNTHPRFSFVLLGSCVRVVETEKLSLKQKYLSVCLLVHRKGNRTGRMQISVFKIPIFDSLAEVRRPFVVVVVVYVIVYLSTPGWTHSVWQLQTLGWLLTWFWRCTILDRHQGSGFWIR